MAQLALADAPELAPAFATTVQRDPPLSFSVNGSGGWKTGTYDPVRKLDYQFALCDES